jgi:DNA-binding IclR family transcriptional regulator
MTEELAPEITHGGTPTSVAARVMAILDAFAAEGPLLRTGDVTRITGLPSATAGRLLKELVELGGLRRLGRGQYSLGPRLQHVGALGTALCQTWIAVQPWVEMLARATGSPAHLIVLNGYEGLRLAEAHGEAALIAPCWVIERLLLHATAAGLVLLAFGSRHLAEHTLNTPLTRYTPHTLVAGHRVRDVLDDVRRAGFAISREQHRLGQSAIAVPLRNRPGHVVGAVELTVRRGEEIGRRQAVLAHYARLASTQLGLTRSHHETITPLTQRRSTAADACSSLPSA